MSLEEEAVLVVDLCGEGVLAAVSVTCFSIGAPASVDRLLEMPLRTESRDCTSIVRLGFLVVLPEAFSPSGAVLSSASK